MNNQGTYIKKNLKKRRIIQLTLEGEFVAEFESIIQASYTVDIEASYISRVCRGKGMASGGYMWRYAEDYYMLIDRGEKIHLPKKRGIKRKVVQLTLAGEFIAEFESIIQASYIVDIEASYISGVCRGKGMTSGGYMWRYAEDYYILIEKGGKIQLPQYQNKRRVVQLTIDRGEKIQYFRNKKGRRVVQLTLEGEFITEFESISEAVHELGMNPGNIVRVCREQPATAGGYIWRYAEDYYMLIDRGEKIHLPKKRGRKRKVVQLTLKGEFIAEFDSMSEAEHKLNIGISNIFRACRGKNATAGGYMWKYAEDYSG